MEPIIAERGTVKAEEHAKVGVYHLEKAILIILLEAKQNRECLGTAKISHRGKIYREGPMNDGITRGILNKLEEEGKVEQCTQENRQNGWTLTKGEPD